MQRPEALHPSSWALLEFLGQRSLLGFGVLLVWMVLFHMLVNVWLLCVFTSLLVVLGSWLGSQAVLDSGSIVHLERFIPLERLPESPESECQLDREIQSTVHKIIRDFVSSWYRTVSTEPEFELQVESAMLAMAMELKRRAKRVDRRALTRRVLDLCGSHLRSYKKAKQLMVEEKEPNADNSLWGLYCQAGSPHPALKSSALEVNYTRAIVDLLLHVLVPAPHLETRTGRFVVGELITCNVLLPLIGKLSEPDWLNVLIVDIFTKSGQQASEEVQPTNTLPTPPLLPPQHTLQQNLEVPSTLTLSIPLETPIVTEPPTPELAAYDITDSEELYSQQVVEEEETGPDVGTKLFVAGKPSVSPMEYLRPGKFNPFYQEADSDLESPLSDFKKSSMESLVLIGDEMLSDRLPECATPTDAYSVMDPEDELQASAGLGEGSCPRVLIPEQPDRPNTLTDLADTRLSGNGAVQGVLSEPEKEPSGVTFAPKSNSSELRVPTPTLQMCSPTTVVAPLSPFSFEPPSSPEGPVIIQNLRISGTITAKEHRGTGSHPYTLYTIKYETAVDSENPDVPQSVAYHMVNRRYSEFLNLQTRLEEKPELRKILKNVKGPKKIFPDLPFGNMDSDKVEARKGLLETFLKQLCAIPETANSEEMQEFLALNTDARIAFVKKPFIVARIDKIVVNAIVDTLKTAFPRSEPQSPTEDVDTEPDGKAPSDTKKTKSRLRFSSKIAPVLNVIDMQPKVLYCFDERSTVFSGLSLAGLEAFITEQERLVGKVPVLLREAEGEKDVCLANSDVWQRPGKQHHGVACHEASAEMALADVALDILCLLMRDQWSWLCTENIQRTIRLMFGTLIDRWLDVGVANLTCTQYWVVYLRVLQEAIWPGGTLPAQPRPERTPQQKENTHRLSLQCLMRLIPDLVSDLLGYEKYRMTWQTALESLQDPQINRHLVYCVWDLLLEFLIPESSSEEFQKLLLYSLSGVAEKPSI
ncbi:sorting nexin-19 isoform X1 [Scleropages formosus]|uniref:Sorting nexin 19a n=1 Tax=Scleropages formosus TaxID=113540 RepID=A0A8C9QSD5_SCLFO|nr:sorting nexin-19 isoform X1 [Scleropages formosus]XP_018598454.1 sorting nexin-19 isoform X1 [Scleropages formosus]